MTKHMGFWVFLEGCGDETRSFIESFSEVVSVSVKDFDNGSMRGGDRDRDVWDVGLHHDGEDVGYMMLLENARVGGGYDIREIESGYDFGDFEREFVFDVTRSVENTPANSIALLDWIERWVL